MYMHMCECSTHAANVSAINIWGDTNPDLFLLIDGLGGFSWLLRSDDIVFLRGRRSGC